jgi:hypothetical protein
VSDDEPRRLKVHKVTLLVVDHDELGAEDVTREIESVRYPNHCISPDVMAIETREIDWTDEHPLNFTSKQRAAFDELFPEVRRG